MSTITIQLDEDDIREILAKRWKADPKDIEFTVEKLNYGNDYDYADGRRERIHATITVKDAPNDE